MSIGKQVPLAHAGTAMWACPGMMQVRHAATPPQMNSAFPALALASMLLVQMLASMTFVAASILAPAVAPMLGHAPERVGLYVGLGYLAAMASGLRCGVWVARWGAIRLTQRGLLACAAGALLAGLGPAQTLLAAAVLIGLGYGVVNPTAAAVLSQHAPAHSRGLFFSVKQTGVPLGVALSGLMMPVGLTLLGWRLTAVVVAATCASMSLALWPTISRLDPPRPSPAEAAAQVPLALLRRVWHAPALRVLSLTSLTYTLTQQVYVTFIVSMLNLTLGWTLAAAAGLLALSQGLAALARILFGTVGDRWVPPGWVLVGLGAAMATSCLGLAAAAASVLPWALVGAAALACAGTAMGWNGVFYGALAQHVPRAEMAAVAGAAQFFTFGGAMLGPLLFGEAVRAGAEYPLAWAALALVPAVAATALARALVNAPRTPPA
jgi:MFS family permease